MAEFFQISMLLDECETCITDYIEKKMTPLNYIELDIVCDVLLLCERFKLKRCWTALKKGILASTGTALETLVKHDKFSKLSYETRCKIYEDVVVALCKTSTY